MKKLLIILLCVPLIGLGEQTNISTKTTDTIKFLDGTVVINDVKTNAEYYQAMLSSINEEIRTKRIKRDTVEYEALIEVEIYYYELINAAEYFNIEHLSPQAEKVENKLQQYLTNNPEKVQFHINRGKIYNPHTGFDLSPDNVYGDLNLNEKKQNTIDLDKRAIYITKIKDKNRNKNYNDGAIGLVEIERRYSTDELYCFKKPIGNGIVIVEVIIDADGNVIEINQESFYTNIASFYNTKTKKQKKQKKILFDCIKENFKLSPVGGDDEKNVKMTLKINFEY